MDLEGDALCLHFERVISIEVVRSFFQLDKDIVDMGELRCDI